MTRAERGRFGWSAAGLAALIVLVAIALTAGDGPSTSSLSRGLLALAATGAILVAFAALGKALRRAEPTDAAAPPPQEDGPGRVTEGIRIAFNTYAVVALAFCAVVIVLAAPIIVSQLTGGLRGEFDTVIEAAEALLQRIGPAALVLAGFVAVLSIPLVLYRAFVQERQTQTQEGLLVETIEARAQAEKNAQRTDVTQRLLRAIELLGASQPITRVETRRVQDTIVDTAGQARSITREVPVQVTVQEPAIEIRLGAINILEALAKESLANHWPIMETMLAYIRERRGRAVDYLSADEETRLEVPKDAPVAERIKAAKKRVRLIRRRLRARHALPPDSTRTDYAKANAQAEDVAAAVSVIRRRNDDQVRLELGLEPNAPLPEVDWDAFETANPEPNEDAPAAERIAWAEAKKAAVEAWRRAAPRPTLAFDPGATPLARADLRGVDWRRQGLPGARMEGADLREARMEGADLNRARMAGAALIGARMEGANLRWARMEGADLSWARMEGATLFGARMEGADLREARMEGADLNRARMEGAALIGARMEGANLRWARMEGADLFGARMAGADLFGARMEGADLFEARMEGACVVGARFSKSSSSGADAAPATSAPDEDDDVKGLTQATIDRTFGDAATARTLPDGLVAPDHWAITELDFSEAHRAWRAWRIEQGFDPAPSTEDDE